MTAQNQTESVSLLWVTRRTALKKLGGFMRLVGIFSPSLKEKLKNLKRCLFSQYIPLETSSMVSENQFYSVLLPYYPENAENGKSFESFIPQKRPKI